MGSRRPRCFLALSCRTDGVGNVAYNGCAERWIGSCAVPCRVRLLSSLRWVFWIADSHRLDPPTPFLYMRTSLLRPRAGINLNDWFCHKHTIEDNLLCHYFFVDAIRMMQMNMPVDIQLKMKWYVRLNVQSVVKI